MGRRKFEEGDLCTLNRSKAKSSLCEKYDEGVVFRVSGYNKGRHNRYVVHPVGESERTNKIRPIYLDEHDGPASTDLQTQLEFTKKRIESLEGKKKEAERKLRRVQDKIDFRDRWELDEFDENLWHAAKIHDIIAEGDRDRDAEILSIADILKIC